MEILMNVWLAFNIVFGFWTARNFTMSFIAFLKRQNYVQNDLGKFLDLLVLVSILAHSLTVN